MTKPKYPASGARAMTREARFAIPPVTRATKQFAHASSQEIKSEGRKGRLIVGKRPDWPSQPED